MNKSNPHENGRQDAIHNNGNNTHKYPTQHRKIYAKGYKEGQLTRAILKRTRNLPE